MRLPHLHWHRTVRRGRGGNAYRQCRCGDREIHHPDRTQPLDYSWLERGTFRSMPTRGPIGAGGAGEARAR